MMVNIVSTTRMEMAVIQREEGSDGEAVEEGRELDWTRGEGGEKGELLPSSPRLATITEYRMLSARLCNLTVSTPRSTVMLVTSQSAANTRTM